MKNLQGQYQISKRSNGVKLCLHLLAAVLLILVPILLARAQRPENATTVSNVSSHPTANGTVVQIAADSSLNRAQTFQDRDGFHIVVPDAGVSDLVKSSKGVRVRRVGTAIEILLQTKQGTPVTVQTIDNRINLTVEGKLDNGVESDSQVTQERNQSQSTSPSGYSLPTDYSASQSYSTGSSYPAETTSSTVAPTAPPTSTPAADQGQVRDAGEYQTKEEGNVTDAPEEDGVVSSVFSGTGIAVILVLAIVGLLVARKFRSPKVGTLKVVESADDEDHAGADNYAGESSKSNESNTALVRSGRGASTNGQSRERKGLVRQTPTAPTSLFGAYRIDQEVGKLVLGQAHRMDVLSSRASEDRRAIQASLIKTIVSSEYTEDERRRARGALEEYGFVARESAALLLAADAFERTSAARSLGEMGSPAALPFLLEALYDVESIVRNQAVVSIGELKVPSAIGALLDMARKHPDVPSSLVSRALSACSVEGLDFFDAMSPATAFLTTGVNETGQFDFVPIEPTSSVVELPDSLEDEGLVEALENASSEHVEERSEGVKNLAQYSSKSAVTALVSIIQRDPESTIRALAVSGLAFIDHESVFPAVLIGMADESREVRAAAARALSRLSFDRSEAYVYVLQTSDDETLGNVAQACIKAGILSQNIDRLASGDRRQAYEAFALVSLLAKAKLIAPVLEAVQHHRDPTVRLSAVSLLAATGQTYVFEQLQQLAAKDEIDEEVKTALLEGMYRLEQARPKEEDPLCEFIIRESDEEFEAKECVEDKSVFEFNERTEVDKVEL